jgi:hypothetical protein
MMHLEEMALESFAMWLIARMCIVGVTKMLTQLASCMLVW